MAFPSISIASIIVGFISFAFTFFTFLNVFWESIMTMWAAPREIRGTLDNLRSELYGERDHFKEALRSSKSKKSATRSHADTGALKLLNDTVKYMLRRFRDLEEPFIQELPSRKEMDLEKFEQSVRVDYITMGFYQRYMWLRTKSDVIALADQVSRVQLRRIAFDTNCNLL